MVPCRDVWALSLRRGESGIQTLAFKTGCLGRTRGRTGLLNGASMACMLQPGSGLCAEGGGMQGFPLGESAPVVKLEQAVQLAARLVEQRQKVLEIEAGRGPGCGELHRVGGARRGVGWVRGAATHGIAQARQQAQHRTAAAPAAARGAPSPTPAPPSLAVSVAPLPHAISPAATPGPASLAASPPVASSSAWRCMGEGEGVGALAWAPARTEQAVANAACVALAWCSAASTSKADRLEAKAALISSACSAPLPSVSSCANARRAASIQRSGRGGAGRAARLRRLGDCDPRGAVAAAVPSAQPVSHTPPAHPTHPCTCPGRLSSR